MEDDVVLPDEVDEVGPLVLPVAPPRVGRALALGPLLRGGDVADGRVEPDVEHLPLGALDGDGHAPREVPRHRAVREPGVEPAPDLPAHVRLPLRVLGDPGFEARLELAEGEVPVRGRADLGDGVGEGAARVLQLFRRERGAAVLALVAVGVLVATDGARPTDEAIGEEEAGFGVVELLLGALGEDAGVVERAEEVLARGVVRGRGRPAVIVERHPEAAEGFFDLRVVAVHDLLRLDAFLAGAEHDRDAVLVGAADVEDVAALEALVAAEEVGGEVGAGEVAEVERPVGVGERGGDEEAAGRGAVGHGAGCVWRGRESYGAAPSGVRAGSAKTSAGMGIGRSAAWQAGRSGPTFARSCGRVRPSPSPDLP